MVGKIKELEDQSPCKLNIGTCIMYYTHNLRNINSNVFHYVNLKFDLISYNSSEFNLRKLCVQLFYFQSCRQHGLKLVGSEQMMPDLQCILDYLAKLFFPN